MEKNIRDKILKKNVVTGIVGMGYVGLPLAMAAVKKGMKVIGFDIDKEKIKFLNNGINYIKHLDKKDFKEFCESEKFQASSDFSKLKDVDVIVVCVPTPLTKNKDPELKYIISTTETIAKILRKRQLIILESTTYPGTTDELMKNMLEKTGFKEGEDFYLAFSPEREDPGRKDYTTTTTPKVVGGVSKISGELATIFYSLFIDKVVPVKNARTAEATKLTENIFRAVNIALVNELKIIYDRMGIDIWDVLDAASTKPFGFMRFNPGPGWGGHCIPLDPFYLTWKAKEYGLNSNFIEHAGEINRKMPEYVIEKLNLGLNYKKRCVKDSKILLIGVAYKKDIDDPRESPAFEIIELLLNLGAKVSYYDPYIFELPKMREWPKLPKLKSVQITSKKIANYDAVIIVTNHSNVDYDLIQKNANLIIDTRGVYKMSHKNVLKA